MAKVTGFDATHEVFPNGDVVALPKLVHQVAHPFQKTRITKRRTLTPGVTDRGYAFVILNDGSGMSERRYVHRIVATAFIENPLLLPQVNHKDRNKLNNSVENLEWCDASHNIKHRYATDLVR